MNHPDPLEGALAGRVERPISLDDWAGGLPQTRAKLPAVRIGPLRLRDEVELCLKQVKWIEAIEFVESFDHLGAGYGGFNEDQEYFGYRMPI
ncbi:MAG: hypothetical protein FGM50_00485 [Mycobacterium sp.]|nr:hypothetical protein [Mycobacterium sp.]